MTEASGLPKGSIGQRDDADPLDPRSILTSIGEVVYDWNISTDRLAFGLNVHDVLGFAQNQRIDSGRGYAAFIEPGSGRTRHDMVLGASHEGTAAGGSYRTRYGLRTRPDHLILVEDSGRWLPGSDGRPASAHGVLRVIRPNMRPIAELEQGSAGINRALITTDLTAELADAARLRRPTTLMVAAVDDLGALNERLGYEAADELVATVMARLGSVMRNRDRLVRYGGNRFALVLASCPADQASAAALRFITAVDKDPVTTGGGPVLIAMRVGVAVAPGDGLDAPTLLRHAEQALAEAKRRSVTHLAYSGRLGETLTNRRTEEHGLDIVAALNERRIRIARQPVVETRSRERAFDEVLMRIERPDGSIVPACEVIPTAERLGLIRLVDHRVLELAVACLMREPQTRLAINVSAMTLRDPEWLPALSAHLVAHAGVAKRLIVEITETVAIQDLAAAKAALLAVKALGAAIAIDDFGAGYTSFRHLRDFPIDMIKIDGAFVQNLSRSTDDRFFVRALVDLARQLGVAVVAEWVEDEEAAALLADWGVDYLQGDSIGGGPELDAEPANGKLRMASGL